MSESAEDRWQCSICIERPRGTVVTSCGHFFCGECIRRAIGSGIESCPLCRSVLYSQRGSIFPIDTYMNDPLIVSGEQANEEATAKFVGAVARALLPVSGSSVSPNVDSQMKSILDAFKEKEKATVECIRKLREEKEKALDKLKVENRDIKNECRDLKLSNNNLQRELEDAKRQIKEMHAGMNQLVACMHKGAHAMAVREGRQDMAGALSENCQPMESHTSLTVGRDCFIPCLGVVSEEVLAGVSRLTLNKVELTDRDLWRIHKCSNLKALSIEECTGRICLGTQMPHGNSPTRENCDDTERVRGISCLEEITISNCMNIKEIKGLNTLACISRLRFINSNISDDCVANISENKHILELEFQDCANITSLRPLANSQLIESLVISNCINLESEINVLAALNRLRELRLSRLAINDATLRDLDVSKCLRTLDLSHCTGITDVSPLSELSSLRTLDLSHCTGITDVSPLSKLSSLRTFDLSHCTGITDVSPLSTLSGLEVLNLSGCTGVASGVDSLCSLRMLRELRLSRLAINDAVLRDIVVLKCLRTLDLSHCTGITNVSPLSTLSGLEVLNLSGCADITDISPLSDLNIMHTLNLSSALA
ncbi:putative leucine rich repeat protein (LRRP) [Trypanosoma vivax]|nr:putative leucine rich repeat protein (LRRP) [Trypanosoma vivax]